MSLNQRSEKNLIGVHEDLVRVVRLADELMHKGSNPIQIIVTEGLRTKERQAQLFQARATKTMNSRHLTGHAIDLAASINGQVRWDWPLYSQIASAMKTAARQLLIEITWGGDWTTLKDGPHFELNWKQYPA